MNNILLSGLVTFSIIGALPCFADTVQKEVKVEKSADGSFSGSATTERTDAAGTTESITTKERNIIGPDGASKHSVGTETTTDPKGILNKTWSKTETETQINAKGDSKKTVEAASMDAVGTKSHLKEQTAKKLKADGTVETKRHVEAATDPKGLMNKDSAEITTTTKE